MASLVEISDGIEQFDYHNLLFTGGQGEFLSCDDNVALWWDGNQCGKSFALATLAHDVCRGVSRFTQIPWKPPCQVIVCGVSWEQMEPMMRKLWETAPKEELDPRNSFDPGRGITGKPPRLHYVKGPGKGSVINFKTYEQGAKRVEGFTVPLVILDEPPPESFYGAIRPRVMKYGGWVRVGFTPTLTSPPLQWLWDMVDEQKITEFNWTVTEDACWLRQLDGRKVMSGPWKTQAELDEYEAELIAAEVEMRMGRSRFPIVKDRWLTNFIEAYNVADVAPNPRQPDLRYAIGVDHGIQAGKQAASLQACWQPYGEMPTVWYLDESIADGFSDTEEDAVAILQMLDRNGLSYDQIEIWVGDRAAESKKQGVRKDNRKLRSALARLLNRPYHMTKQIGTPRKHEGSMSHGAGTMNAMFYRRRAWVRPHMQATISAFKHFNGHPHHPGKDIFDAHRYATERLVQVGSWMQSAPQQARRGGR